MEIKHNNDLTIDEVFKLYDSNGWTAYAEDKEKLMRAIKNSYTISAYIDGELVGMVRAVTDHETILYVQDILIEPRLQRQGIGSVLMNEMMETFSGIRQKMLLTDETPKTRGFYESLGYTSCDKGIVTAFMNFKLL